MFTPSEGRLDTNNYPGRRFLQVAVIFLGLGLSTALSVTAAPQSPTSPPASAEERASLRQTLESRYEVLPVRDGIALKPRQPRAGIRTIEVTADGVAVNGEKVSARTLRDWLGGDADSILRLQGLGAAEQRQIFGLEGGSAPPAAPPTPAPEASPEDESVPAEVTTGETEVSEETAQAETPEPAAEEHSGNRYSSGSRVNVGGSVTVDKDEVVQEAVAIGGSATVEGEVADGVTAVGGPARINGKVEGEVVSVGSSVWLGSHSEVGGDVTSVGGRVHREPGAKVHGTIHEVGFLPFGRGVHFGRDRDVWPFWGGVSDVMGSLMRTVLLALLVCLVLLVARVPLERVDRQLTTRPWPSAAAGLAGVVFFWPLLAAVTVLLAITIIGCALFLLYPFLFLYLGLLALLGYTAVAYRLGRVLEARFNRSFGSPYVAAIVGVLMIQVWSVLGNVLDLLPGPFGFMVGLVGFLVQAVAWIVGIGAVILARFGLAPGYWPQRGAPVPLVPPPPMSPAPSPVPYDQPVEPLPLSGMEPEPPAEWTEPEQ